MTDTLPDFTLPDVTHGADDIALPFQVEELDVRGRLVRLGPALDALIARHNYPPQVSRLVGEMVALGFLIGSALKFDGKFILQAQTDGPVRLVVADISTPDTVRALARFDADKVSQAIAAGKASAAELLGSGQLVLTIDQGTASQRYQGIVPLDGQGLERAADDYFRQSEQIPTCVKLAVGTETREGGKEQWRAGALMVQYLPKASPERNAEQPPLDASMPDDPWLEARALADTVEPVELLDPELSPERLLYRLFHERGARVYDPLPLREKCTCNRERIKAMLRSFSADDRAHMVEDGKIRVTCDYCSTSEMFDPAEL